MSRLLAEHDRLVGQATERGRLAKYADALKLIDQAEAQIDPARAIRDQLGNTVDVTVLDEWIARNADYDIALRNLYNAISKVGKKVRQRDPGRGQRPRPPREPGSHRTPAAWWSSWPRSDGAG